MSFAEQEYPMHDDEVFSATGITFSYDWDDECEREDEDDVCLSSTGKVIDPDAKPDIDILKNYDIFFRCQFNHIMAYTIDQCETHRNTTHSMRMKFSCKECSYGPCDCSHGWSNVCHLEDDRKAEMEAIEFDKVLRDVSNAGNIL